MKAKQLFPNNATPDAEDMERHYAASIILQSKALDIAMFIMQREIVWTRMVPTAATDGIYTYVNPDFYLRLASDSQRAFLLGHEGCHQILRHVLRAVGFRQRGYHSHRDGKQIGWNDRLWNVAGDLVINDYLKSRGLEPIPEGLYDDEVSGNDSVDKVYVDRWQNQAEDEEGQPGKESDEDGKTGDEGFPGKSEPSDDDDDDSDSDDMSGSGGDDDTADDSSESDDSGAADDSDVDAPTGHGGWDYHLDPEYEGDEEEQASGREQDEAEIDRQVEEAIKQAQEQDPSYGEGSLTGRAFGERTRELSSVNWTIELAEWMRNCANSSNDSSWKRIHRRRFAVYGVLTPTPIGQLEQMVLGVDISGSMTYNLGNVIAEVANAIDQLNPTNGCLVIWFTDTSIVQVDEVMSGQELLDVQKPSSFGAEKPSLVLDYLEENGIYYDCLMIFSDGCFTVNPTEEWDLLAQAGALVILDQEPDDHWAYYSPLPHIERTGIRYVVANDN